LAASRISPAVVVIEPVRRAVRHRLMDGPPRVSWSVTGRTFTRPPRQYRCMPGRPELARLPDGDRALNGLGGGGALHESSGRA
jgi:hypothetical protein